MANIKSQIKRNKTNEKARLRNRAVKSELKTYTRKVKAAISTGDAEAAGEALKTASRKLDKAVSKGVIHENQAATRKTGPAKLAAAVGACGSPRPIRRGPAHHHGVRGLVMSGSYPGRDCGAEPNEPCGTHRARRARQIPITIRCTDH